MFQVEDIRIGRIEAVLYASEGTIRLAKDEGTIQMVKETAYDHIVNIMKGICPWQEGNKQ